MIQPFLTFDALGKLSAEELRDIARFIVDEDQYIPLDKDVIARGIIMPFLREAVGDRDRSKDQVLRAALERTAESLGGKRQDWSTISDQEIIERIRADWLCRFRKRLDQLDEVQRQEIMEAAQQAFAAKAKVAGIAPAAIAGIMAGNAAGFGIYMATTTTIAAVGNAIGVVFPWALYQGATTALGMALGPVGFVVIAGTTVAAFAALDWQAARKDRAIRLQMVMIGLLLGLAPWLWYELPVTADRKQVDTAFRAIAKSTHPDTVSEHVPEWMRSSMIEWFLTSVEYKDRIIKSMENDE